MMFKCTKCQKECRVFSRGKRCIQFLSECCESTVSVTMPKAKPSL